MGRSDNGQTECLQGHAAVATSKKVNQKKLRFILHSVLNFGNFFTHTLLYFIWVFFFLDGDREIGVLQTHWSADKPHESLSKCTLLRWRTIYITRRKKKIKWYTRLIPASTRYSHYKTKWGRKQEPLSAFFAHFIQQWKWQCTQLVGRYVTRWPAWLCLESARQLQARLSVAALHLCSSHSLGTQIILYRDNG